MVALFKNKFLEHGQFFLALIVFFIGIFFLVRPFKNMIFRDDDYVLVAHSQISTFQDIKTVFTSDQLVWFDSTGKRASSAFNALYRPVGFLFFAGLVNLFKKKSQYVFQASLALHTINAVIVFYFLGLFLPLLFAFFGALFFLFHPSLGWLYQLCTIQDILFLTLFFITIAFYRKYLLSGRFYYCALSALFYLLTLLTKEFILVFPLILFVYGIAFNKKSSLHSFFAALFNQLYLFVIINIGYIALRIYLFGLNTDSSQFHLSLGSYNVKEALWTYIEMTKELVGFTFLVNPNPRIRMVFLLPLLSIFIVWFYKSAQKKLLVFIVFSLVVMVWPCFILTFPTPRYLYIGLPFFILFFLYAATTSCAAHRFSTLALLCASMVPWGFYHVTTSFAIHNSVAALVVNAIQSIDPLIDDSEKEVVFINFPKLFYIPTFDATARFYLKHNTFKIKEYCGMGFCGTGYECRDPIALSATPGGCRFASSTLDTVFVYATPELKAGSDIDGGASDIVSKYHIDRKEGDWKISEYSVFFKKNIDELLRQYTFIAWNNEEKKFYKLIEGQL
jgi:hypothetical protein